MSAEHSSDHYQETNLNQEIFRGNALLHAITHKKSNIHRRYLGHREQEERFVKEEDELTALLMGPLAFLPCADITNFWAKISAAGWSTENWSKEKTCSAVMDFWPKRYYQERKYIEPDLFVTLTREDGTKRYLLVEFKWRASLSGKLQLQDQWLKFLTEEERKSAIHIFIGPDISYGLKAITKDKQDNVDTWGGRLLLCSWHKIQGELSSLAKDDMTSLGKWAFQVMQVLTALNIRPYRGFSELCTPGMRPKERTIFWTTP